MWETGEDSGAGGDVLPFDRPDRGGGGGFGGRRGYPDEEPPDDGFGDWEDHGRYDEGYADRFYGPDLGDLTMVVLMDDKVVETVRRPVRGSGYECAALELGRGAPPPAPRVVEVPAQPRHELELTWLRKLVGGAAQLQALTGDPLPDEPLEVAPVPADLRERLTAIAARVDAVALLHFGIEGRTACRRLLSRAVAAEPALLRGYEKDDVCAGAVVHAVAKANDLIGPGCAVTATALWTSAGLRSSPHDRARRMAHAVAGTDGVVPRDPYYQGVPDVWRLGSPDYLTGRFRACLISLRDIAEAERRPAPPY